MMKVGILGGGQLGRMMLQAAANYPVITHVMDNDPDAPAALLCAHFTTGDIRDYDDVCKFGRSMDAITIEIESVNVEALEQLEKEGVKVYPRPSALRIIRDKIIQKQFYRDHDIPTAPYVVTKSRSELNAQESMLPAVHKIGQGGYDGRGVKLMMKKEDFADGFDAPSILEKRVDIAKEIAQIVAINEKGETAIYPPVEMIFDPVRNLLDYQISPAELPQQTLWRMEAIALKVVRDLASPGIFAVEMFLDRQGAVFTNETAPRVHNSGHHTIEANYSSQFDMLWRVLLGYPLGNPKHIIPAAIVNLIGADGHSGPAQYEGLNDILRLENVFVHLYGKKETRPGRKMGHCTILSNEKRDLVHKANRIRHELKVTSTP